MNIADGTAIVAPPGVIGEVVESIRLAHHHQVDTGATSAPEHQAVQEAAKAAAAASAVTSTVSAPTRAAAPATKTKTRNGGAKRSAGSGGSATTTATPGDPAVSVSLPREVYDHFAGKAAADERTLATYLKRVLRAVYNQETQQAEPSNQC